MSRLAPTLLANCTARSPREGPNLATPSARRRGACVRSYSAKAARSEKTYLETTLMRVSPIPSESRMISSADLAPPRTTSARWPASSHVRYSPATSASGSVAVTQ